MQLFYDNFWTTYFSYLLIGKKTIEKNEERVETQCEHERINCLKVIT